MGKDQRSGVGHHSCPQLLLLLLHVMLVLLLQHLMLLLAVQLLLLLLLDVHPVAILCPTRLVAQCFHRLPQLRSMEVQASDLLQQCVGLRVEARAKRNRRVR